ncbi:MAG: precorrin-6y C5,15-methyltransferase (decarboxylating) subunit CbiE [Jatrophihabitans sp.]|uniref:precorrin-6y C5,15-methyltransferase (decarboxylating) subunit CbiE n=1 Tax=Jatrophihabitans sp. TaxID=1932789 RepID=UPI003F7D6C52
MVRSVGGMTVTVIGTDGSALDAVARAAVTEADLLVGSARALASVTSGAPRVVLGPLQPALGRLATASAPVVLASGDPGFFGVLRPLRAAGLDCLVLPAASSVAQAFARAGSPWDDAVVVSAHGRALGPAINACRAFGNVAVLTAPGAGPVEIARALDGWDRELVVAERLGHPGERTTRLPAADIAMLEPTRFTDPNVVLCLDPGRPSTMRADNQPAAAPEAGWALPEDAYLHRDSMITKAEVRALVVARLRPRLGRLVLDVGAGCGSVGIECNRLGAAVVALERDPVACETIRRNVARHGASVRVVAGEAPAALAPLPAADAAFVGGGGIPAVTAVAASRTPTVVAAFAALDRMIDAHKVLTTAGYRVEGVQLAAARLADLPGGSLRLTAANPVTVLTAELS